MRSGDVGEERDLSASAHRHLEDPKLLVTRGAYDGQGQPDLRVVIAPRLQHAARRAQRRGRQFTGRRLAVRSRDADDTARKIGPDRARQIGECRQRIVDADHGHSSRTAIGTAQSRWRPAPNVHHQGRCTRHGRRRAVVIAIDFLAGQREEHLARPHETAVEGGTREGGVRRRRTEQAAAHRTNRERDRARGRSGSDVRGGRSRLGLCRRFNARPRHGVGPPEAFAENAAAASSRSSK
jgi:hypothetical protein